MRLPAVRERNLVDRFRRRADLRDAPRRNQSTALPGTVNDACPSEPEGSPTRPVCLS